MARKAQTPPGAVYLIESLDWPMINMDSVKAVPPGLEALARPNPFKPGFFMIPVCKRGAHDGGLPLEAYSDPVKAEARCRELEHTARQQSNPFRFGEKIADWTHLDQPRLRDWVLDLARFVTRRSLRP